MVVTTFVCDHCEKRQQAFDYKELAGKYGWWKICVNDFISIHGCCKEHAILYFQKICES